MAIVFVIIGSAIGIAAILVAAVLLRGWALSILWGWFAVPIFGLPALAVPQAIAVSLVVAFLTHQYVPTKKDDTWTPWVTALLTPFLVLGIGWIVKQYLPQS